MGITKIENRLLSVTINSLGAEVISLIDKKDGVEHMWKGDPKFWPRRAPILFPCVGESRNGKINVDGKDYPMGRHGFVRNMEFELLSSDDSSCAFELRSNSETRHQYPFEFSFRVKFELKENRLIQSFEVENVGNEKLGFQLGGHPAFAVPFGTNGLLHDYIVKFDQPLNAERHLLTNDGVYSGETRSVLDNDDFFPLSYELFNEDALVFKDISSKSVWIQHKEGGKKLMMDYEGFPHLGVWSVPGADYVCLEPWIGCADSFDQREDFFLKDSIIRLEAGQEFRAQFTISLD